jgi:RNA polymerase sigma-70 factor (ECF subfamily)
VEEEDVELGELARRIAAGRADRSATEGELFRRFAPRIRLYGLRHLRDEAAAHDLVQQVLVLAIESLRDGRVREPDRIASFVLGSCRMIALDAKRGERRRELLLERHWMPPEPAPEQSAPLDLERLRGCLERLPPREQAVVLLTFYGERDADEIAGELAMTKGNVRVVRHRAVGHLQECMGVRESEDAS